MLKKDDIVQVKIDDIGNDGEGIGRVDGFTLFIKDAVIGDTVQALIMKMKKTYGYARLLMVTEPSLYRVDAACPVARQCGGCQLQYMSYEKQLDFKENKILNHLRRIGKFDDIPLEPIIGMKNPFGYRNKAQFPVGRNKDGRLVAGFYAGRTHSIIDNRKCILGVPENEIILEKVLSFMEDYGIAPYDEETGRGLVRHVLTRYGFKTKQIMVCIIINGKGIPHKDKLIESLCQIQGMASISLNINSDRTNVILGKEIINLWGQTYIEDYIGKIKFQISPLSFYQVNPMQTEKLYGLALEYAGLTGKETVWDLYCGIGTISLFLAEKARQVYGVEVVPEAIRDARNNAVINGIENAEFFVGKAEEILPQKFKEEGITADVVVVDPPRKGCDESLLGTIVQMAPEKVVYVSCDSATLARDLRYLCDRGYELLRCRGVDQFGETVHVETVCLLINRNSKPEPYIKFDLDMEYREAKY